MSQYKKEFPFKVAFPPQPMTNVLAEWLAKKGVKQAHVAGKALSYITLSNAFLSPSQKPRNMHTSLSSSTEASRNNSRVRIDT
jgi:hypothetical protein